MMRSVTATSRGFIDETVPTPMVTPQDLLVRVEAVALNPHDVKAMARLTGKQTARYGFDVVGIVQKVGAAVTDFRVGQRVFYMGDDRRPGGFATQQVVDARLVALAPDRLSLTETAGLPLVSITAYELLFEKLGFIPRKNANRGQSVLVINGAGGVGSLLTQLADWAGLKVLATASPTHFDWLRQNRVAVPLDYHFPLAAQANQAVDATVVLTHLQDYFPVAVSLTKPLGKIATVVSAANGLPLDALFGKSLTVATEMVFSKFLAADQVNNQGEILNLMAKLFATGALHPITTQVLTGGITARNLTAAVARQQAMHVNGKIVITEAE